MIWDAGNDCYRKYSPKNVEVLPGKHILINSEIDGTFPSHPDPTEEKNLKQLKEKVAISNTEYE